MPTTSRTARRSAEQSSTLLLTAALDLFRRKGYAATTTREIAREAEVPERILFRHFPTKALLFEAAVALPLVDLVESFNDAWRDRDVSGFTAGQAVETFVGGLLDLFRESRLLLLDLAALRSAGGRAVDLANPLQPELFATMFEVLLELATREGQAVELHTESLFIDLRLCFGTVLSMALFGEILCSGLEPPPTEDALVQHLGRFILGGMDVRPDALLDRSPATDPVRAEQA